MMRVLHVVILLWGVTYCIANYSEAKRGAAELLRDVGLVRAE